MSFTMLSTAHAPAARRPVLAELLPAVRWRSAALVAGGAALTAVASQIRIPLGFTPVPINLATFAVALTGGALGVRRGVASMLLYLAVGLVGMPVFADTSSGWATFSGATGGYLVGYVFLAGITGWAARRGRDRHLVTSVAAVVVGNLVLYTLGTLWLAHTLNVPVFGWESSGFTMGLRPFLAGDAVKMAAAGALFPAAWSLLRKG
ncbi:biotin transporter BioY [Desertimonas flava]|uniref:biotin transporter BioY n=1 Tax=Desertimonas flava TaxID=2064846 RepID=UPI0013C4A55A|nr:biotin transporter BioY [Desertimonas flava]